jgi:hypothetical protein
MADADGLTVVRSSRHACRYRRNVERECYLNRQMNAIITVDWSIQVTRQEANSVISGKRRLHLVSALVSACSIRASSQFREIAISLTSR